jgi:hypothetical protein
MTGTPSTHSTSKFDRANVTYRDVRVVITPEGPRHYDVAVSERPGETTHHAVERVVVNTAAMTFDTPVWFIDVELDVGVPVDVPDETAWVWV